MLFTHYFLDEPEIEISSEIVHSGEGYESELTCVVHAHPGAKVSHYSLYLYNI